LVGEDGTRNDKVFNASAEIIAVNTTNSMQKCPCKSDCRQSGEEITRIS
jgi:hypothetical protein